MPALRVLVVGAVLAALTGCTNVTRVSAGPVAAFPGHGHRSYGEEIVVRRGIGTSDFESIGIGEYEARLLVTEETHALSLGAGYSAMRWAGRGLFFASGNPALGFELTREKPLGNAGLHGGLGLGWAFDEVRKERPSSWRMFQELRGPGHACWRTVERHRRVVTLELVGSVDVRGTREPLLTAGVLLGVAFTSEQDDVELPPEPQNFPGFGCADDQPQ